ncbi:MAG: TonB-dependent receptor, partial [Micrococcales bacterium]|nr:TonB-dependent receptor [Micrococcales bacterium]
VEDPANWTLSQIRLRPQTADNTYETAQLNGEWDISDSVTLSGGLFIKSYSFETTELRRDPASCGLAPTGNAEGCIPAGVAGTPLSSFSRLVGLADQWDIPTGSTLTWLIPDYHAADALFDFGSFPMSFIPSRGNNRTVSSGNPLLDPTRATTYDLALEWYFAPDSILSLALFRKEISSFVANDSVTQPFTGNSLGLPDSVAIAACGAVAGCSPTADWVFNQPVNTDGGDLDGFEISYQQPLTFLPGFLSNLGLLANYTYVDSQIEYPNGTTNTLTNLSKRAYNATLYYEDDRFSARVSGTYRDGYLTEVPGRNGSAIEGVVDTFNVDASASYNVNDQLSLTLEGINLTDEVPTQYVGIYNLVSVHHHTGRQFFAGFRYRF